MEYDVQVYPDVITGIPAVLPLRYSTNRAVLKTEFETGLEQTRLLWPAPRRDVRISYSVTTFARAHELRRFYEARGGSYERFSFFFPQTETYVSELVGVCHFTVIAGFELPSLGATSFTLYKNDVALVEGVDWNFIAGTPPDVADFADLSPNTIGIGDVIKFDFTGRLRIIARFASNPFDITEIKDYLGSVTVSLSGLEHEFL